MTHFWLGLIAGLSIGLVVEWLFDWRAWNGRLFASGRPFTAKPVLSQVASPVPLRPSSSPVLSQEAEIYDLPPAPDVRSQPPTSANKDE